jgi:hypothetical protein
MRVQIDEGFEALVNERLRGVHAFRLLLGDPPDSQDQVGKLIYCDIRISL